MVFARMEGRGFRVFDITDLNRTPNGTLWLIEAVFVCQGSAHAHFHVAAFHDEQGDSDAREVSVKAMVSNYNQLRYSFLTDQRLDDLTPKLLFKMWRRAIKRRLRAAIGRGKAALTRTQDQS